MSFICDGIKFMRGFSCLTHMLQVQTVMQDGCFFGGRNTP